MFKRAGLVILLAASAFAAAVMHNGDVVRMVRRGAPVAEVVSSINNSQPGFALFPEDVNSLREDGVPEVVIRAMVARQGGDMLQIGGNAQTAFQPALAGSPVANAYVAPVPARSLLSSERYGIERGTISAFGGAGIIAASGLVRANFGGEVSAGLSRYVGIFGQGSYSPLGGAGLPVAVAGIEAVASNSHRIVPYAKVGGGYLWLTGFGGAPIVSPGGGVRVYVSNRFGFSTDILALCSVRGGGVVVVPTFGFFVQSK